jgi:hypothetical protein
MEKYMDDFENYKRFTGKCKCGCPVHCDHGCQDCEYCPDCECPRCVEEDKNRGYN